MFYNYFINSYDGQFGVIMKEIIYLIILLIIINLLLELFVGQTKLGKFINFCFSAVIVFAVFLNVSNLVTNDTVLQNEKINYEYVADMSYFTEQVNSMEKIIKNRLELEFETPFDVQIDYEIEDINIVYKKVIIKYSSLDNLTEKIKGVVKTYVDCEVECKNE